MNEMNDLLSSRLLLEEIDAISGVMLSFAWLSNKLCNVSLFHLISIGLSDGMSSLNAQKLRDEKKKTFLFVIVFTISRKRPE